MAGPEASSKGRRRTVHAHRLRGQSEFGSFNPCPIQSLPGIHQLARQTSRGYSRIIPEDVPLDACATDTLVKLDESLWRWFDVEVGLASPVSAELRIDS